MADTQPSSGSELRVFVYGTLKCGFGNHFFCQGYDRVEPALVRGRLADRPEGYPTLFVPMADVLAAGTGDLSSDCRRTEGLAAASERAFPSRHHTSRSPAPPWNHVAGEVFTFRDGPDRLHAFDMLEDFTPGRASMYCRIVLPARTGAGVLPCWAYISPHSARFEAEHEPAP